MPKNKPRKPSPPDVQSRMDMVLKAIFSGGGPTPVVIDLSDEVQPNKKFPLTLTQPQRLSLLEHLDLDPRLKKKIRDAGDGKQVVIVTKKELDQLNDKIGRAAVDAPAPHRKRLSAIGSQVAELFAGDHIGNLEKKVAKKSSPKPTKTIYQFIPASGGQQRRHYAPARRQMTSPRRHSGRRSFSGVCSASCHS